MNALSTLTALLAACLVALIVYELRPQPDSTLDPSATTDPARRTAGLAAPNTATTDRSTSLDTLLGRPLFSQTRRPGTEAGPTARTVVATPLPRMTAILIDGTRRSVIFAVPGPQQGNVRPVTVAEGGRVGAFTVESIAPQQVVVLGPEGRQTVRTSFDPTLPAPAPIPRPRGTALSRHRPTGFHTHHHAGGPAARRRHPPIQHPVQHARRPARRRPRSSSMIRFPPPASHTDHPDRL